MLSTEEFRTFAKGVVPFLHVTSLVDGEKYADLLSEKGGNGFPYLVAMDADGGVTAKLPWQERNVAGFEGMMKRGGEFSALLAKKDRTPAEEGQVLVSEIEYGRLKADEARARSAALKGVDDATRKKVDGMILGLDIQAELGKIKDPSGKAVAGKAFAEMWKAGREPGGDDEGFQPFFILMMEHAEAEKDAALFEKALGKMREKFGEEPRAAAFFKKAEERLAKLKEPAVPPPEAPKEPEPPKDK